MFVCTVFEKKTNTNILKTRKKEEKTEQKVTRVETDNKDLNKNEFLVPFSMQILFRKN